LKSLPTGTVTFLFTDIEGSTALLQRLKDAYPTVLAECRRFVRAAVEERSGQEFGAEGDAIFAAFPSARDGLMAAITAQQRILRHPWPSGATVRVRMGLHTGEARVAEGEYIGIDVHRAARICSAGHGGQILLSDTVSALVTKDLPDGVGLRHLGEHRLKDLAHPHRLFQVLAPDLPPGFPPLRSLDAHPHNLPIQLTSFIGREPEIAEIKRLLGAARLVTLTGSGGAGKTRLALQVAANVVEDYPDGVWLAEFAPIADPTLVPKTVASALNVPEQPGQDIAETLVDALRHKALLLVLDNCEHLLAACRDLAQALLRSCSHVRILATSREGLGIPGETLWRVPSLSVPVDIGRLPRPEELVLYDAVRLFVDRAMATSSDFIISNENARAVAQVCQRLDGIPLAIELAAARVKVLAVDQITARLDDRFRLLTGGSRTVLPRQQTLRAAVDWSYLLLAETERVLLRRLSVFAGGWSLDAAEVVCAGGVVEATAILDLLGSLVDKSLVLVETHRGEARYRFLETIRQYGWDRLVESKEDAELRNHHRDWYLDLAESAEPKLRGLEQVAWLERLEIEHDNLRAALEWSKAEAAGGDASLRLAAALHQFWHMRGYLGEGRDWLEVALVASENPSSSLRARALCGAGLLAWRQGDFKRAETLLQDSLALFQQLGDRWGTAYVLHHLAHVMEERGDYGHATGLFEKSLALFKEVDDNWGVGWSLYCLGSTRFDHGDDQATAMLEESLSICREVGNKWTLAYALHALGVVAEKHGDYERAIALLEESMVIVRQVGDQYHLPGLQYRLGRVALHLGDNERAVALFRKSLVLRRETGDKSGLVQCLEGLAYVACARGRYEQATRLFGAADALRETYAVRRLPIDEAEHESRVALARAGLNETAFVASRAEGRAMTLEQAIEYALAPEGQTVGKAPTVEG
jgi:predicted ATPase/class 3 adenylate cyclase